MVKIRNLYFYLLILPLLLPLLSLPLIKFFEASLPQTASLALVVIAFSGIIGGIPYLVLALAIFFWTRKRSESHVRRAILLSPIGMVVLFPVFILVISFIPSMKMDLSGAADFMKAWAFLSAFSIVIGYAYVAIIFGVVRLYRGSAFVDMPA